MAPKVCRLATRNKQNALIIMWTSIASTSARKTPLRATAVAGCRRAARSPARSRSTSVDQFLDVLGVVDVLDADQPDELGMPLVVVEGHLGDRGAAP